MFMWQFLHDVAITHNLLLVLKKLPSVSSYCFLFIYHIIRSLNHLAYKIDKSKKSKKKKWRAYKKSSREREQELTQAFSKRRNRQPQDLLFFMLSSHLGFYGNVLDLGGYISCPSIRDFRFELSLR